MCAGEKIEIPLPDGIEPTPADLELMKATCESVVSIYLDKNREWFDDLRHLEQEDWQITWGLQWSVEARKGRCTESVTAPSIDEAFQRLRNLARLHKIEGCP